LLCTLSDQHKWSAFINYVGFTVSEKLDDEELFSKQSKYAEKSVKIAVGLFVAVMLYSLYVLVFDN